MMKFVTTAVATIALAGFVTTGAMACDAAEATAKFQKRTNQLATPGAVPDSDIGSAWEAMNDGGTALAAQDYDKACEIYDSIAEKYGLEK